MRPAASKDKFKSAWDGATDFFKGVYDKIVGVFKDIGGKFKEIGGNIVNGIKEGVSKAWGALTGFIGEKVGGIVDGVKSKLKINSPSKVFAGIGENMVLGLAEGWEDEYSGIKRKIESGLNFRPASVGVTGTYSGTYGGQGAALSGGNVRGGDTYNFYSPKALDPVSAAREMKKARQQMALSCV